MSSVVAEPSQPQARAVPRPDPLPDHTESGWQRHAPWVVAALVVSAAAAFGSAPVFGLLACGAGGMAVLLPVLAGRWRQAARVLHLSAGVMLVAAWSGAAAAGDFALAAGVVVVAVLATRAAASGLPVSVAPFAGRIPWQFDDTHRRGAARFAIGGLSGGLVVAVLGLCPAMQVAGIALVPVAVRSYLGRFLSAREARAIWFFTMCVHLALLALLIPPYGAVGAAIALVVAETLLFANTSLTLRRRIGESAFTVGHFTAMIAAGLLFVTLTVPKSAEWPFLAAMAAGASIGAIFFPRVPREDERAWGG